jgi:hypothetical protein
MPGHFKEFNYDWFCSVHSAFELSQEEFEEKIHDKNIQFVDVREAEKHLSRRF